RAIAPVFLEKGFTAQARDAALRIEEDDSRHLTDPLGLWASYQFVAELLLKAGSIDQARATAEKIRRLAYQIRGKPADRAKWLGGTARILAETGLSDQARETVQSAIAIAQAIEDPLDRSAAWIAL